MKIGAFYCDTPFAGWVQAAGFVDCLRRTGHEVTGVGIPTMRQITLEQAEKISVPVDDCDLLIFSGLEHYRKWIERFYPRMSSHKAPKVAWYHESFIRDDYSLDFGSYEKMADFHFFPDPRDAEKYKGLWLSLGVDTKIFHNDSSVERDIDIAFIGLLYDKRAAFLEQVKKHLGDTVIQVRAARRIEGDMLPAIAVYDFNGLNVRKSAELLADTLRRIKVFVTFPSLSNVLVAKVLESMACGCTLIAPDQHNMVKTYRAYSNAQQCAEAIKRGYSEFMGEEAAVEAARHSMESRFEEIFAKVGICESV